MLFCLPFSKENEAQMIRVYCNRYIWVFFYGFPCLLHFRCGMYIGECKKGMIVNMLKQAVKYRQYSLGIVPAYNT